MFEVEIEERGGGGGCQPIWFRGVGGSPAMAKEGEEVRGSGLGLRFGIRRR